jgi:hypothetical protein
MSGVAEIGVVGSGVVGGDLEWRGVVVSGVSLGVFMFVPITAEVADTGEFAM